MPRERRRFVIRELGEFYAHADEARVPDRQLRAVLDNIDKFPRFAEDIYLNWYVGYLNGIAKALGYGDTDRVPMMLDDLGIDIEAEARESRRDYDEDD